MVQRAGCRATDRDELVKRNARVARTRARGVSERAHDRVGPFAWRPSHIARDDLVAVAVKRGDDRANVRAAEVDAEEVVVAQTLGSLPASSGEDSALASPTTLLRTACPLLRLSCRLLLGVAKIVVREGEIRKAGESRAAAPRPGVDAVIDDQEGRSIGPPAVHREEVGMRLRTALPYGKCCIGDERVRYAETADARTWA